MTTRQFIGGTLLFTAGLASGGALTAQTSITEPLPVSLSLSPTVLTTPTEAIGSVSGFPVQADEIVIDGVSISLNSKMVDRVVKKYKRENGQLIEVQ